LLCSVGFVAFLFAFMWIVVTLDEKGWLDAAGLVLIVGAILAIGNAISYLIWP